MRTVAHGSLHIERTFDASVGRVFRAFADPKEKVRWACHEDWRMVEADIRVGGWEVSTGGDPRGPTWTFRALYQDIVENRRMVISAAMDRDGELVSVTTLTLEFAADGERTVLTFAEEGVFLDGHDTWENREAGSGLGLDNLAALLAADTEGAAA